MLLAGFGGSDVAGFEAALKLKVGATVAVVVAAAGAVVELLLGAATAVGVAVDDGATGVAAAGVVDELKLKAGVIEGPAGF